MASDSTTQVASSKEDGDKTVTAEEEGGGVGRNIGRASQDGSYSKLEPDWTRYPTDPEVDGSRHFSDLEVVRPGLEVNPSYGHAEAIRSGNLQAFHPGVMGLGESQGPMAAHPGVGKDAEGPIAVEQQPSDGPESAPTKRQTILGLRKPYFWAALAVVVLLVIGGVVGGAVGGTRHQGSSTSTSGSGSGSSGSGSSGGGSATTSSAGSAPTAPATGVKLGSNLAATAWTVSETRYQYRVYYQDDDNAIKESAYDSLTGSWQVATILDGSGVSPNTSIAVASSKQSGSGSATVVCNPSHCDVYLHYLLTRLSRSICTTSTTTLTSKSYFPRTGRSIILHPPGLGSPLTLTLVENSPRTSWGASYARIPLSSPTRHGMSSRFITTLLRKCGRKHLRSRSQVMPRRCSTARL